MAINIGQISNPTLYINPSKKLIKYLQTVEINDDIPIGVKNIIFKNKPAPQNVQKDTKVESLIKEQDNNFIDSLNLENVSSKIDCLEAIPIKNISKTCANGKVLKLSDLYWLYNYIQVSNKVSDEKVYLHDLIEGSEIILPNNKEVPRNEDLEKRCKKLKAEQESREYLKMTKNVDSFRKKFPEDSIGYQMKQINKQLMAVLQFVVSVAAGFAFGFFGLELMVGTLDFGFRLLLGIICALIIALAELYFLAKKLNEDLYYEYNSEKQPPHFKID